MSGVSGSEIGTIYTQGFDLKEAFIIHPQLKKEWSEYYSVIRLKPDESDCGNEEK